MTTPLSQILDIVDDARDWYAEHPVSKAQRDLRERERRTANARQDLARLEQVGTPELVEEARCWLVMCEAQEARARKLAGMP